MEFKSLLISQSKQEHHNAASLKALQRRLRAHCKAAAYVKGETTEEKKI